MCECLSILNIKWHDINCFLRLLINILSFRHPSFNSSSRIPSFKPIKLQLPSPRSLSPSFSFILKHSNFCNLNTTHFLIDCLGIFWTRVLIIALIVSSSLGYFSLIFSVGPLFTMFLIRLHVIEPPFHHSIDSRPLVRAILDMVDLVCGSEICVS